MYSLLGVVGSPLGAALVLFLVIAGLVFYRWYSTRSTPISSVHRPKKDTCKRKFDLEITKRERLLPPPDIDTSNIPAPDPLVKTVLDALGVNDIRIPLREFTGADETAIGGKKVRIASRNSFSADIEYAFQYLEQYYTGLDNKRGLLKVEQRHRYVRRGKTMYNLAVVIPGKSKKRLYVGSHIDSTAGWPNSAEKLAPGANDDGSGSIACMKVVWALLFLIELGFELDYTVVVCHFSGEEQGLWGSFTFADREVKAGHDIDGLVQLDMIAHCLKPGNRVDVHDTEDRNGSHVFVVELLRAALRYGLKLNVVDTHNLALEDRSDHAAFLNHGKKAVLVSGEFSEDGFDPNYHSKEDQEKNCQLGFMLLVVKMVIAMVAHRAGVRK